MYLIDNTNGFFFGLSRRPNLLVEDINKAFYTEYMNPYVKIIAFALLVALMILLVSFTFVEQTIFVRKSRANSAVVSRANSFVFLVPACGVAGDTGQPIRLNVVALTSAGLGKSNVECNVVAPHTYKLAIRAVQGITDTYGKAFFDIQAQDPGIYEVKVLCDDVLINDSQKVCFE